MYVYPDNFGPKMSQHGTIMTAEQALEDWLSSIEIGLNDIEMEELFSMTHFQSSPDHNLDAIAYAADYFGIDLSDDPLPIKLEEN